MKQAIINMVLAAMMGATLASCGSDNFYIEGEIEGLGNQNVRIVYLDDDAVQQLWVPAVEGKFTFSGSSEELTVVDLYARDLTRIAHVAVSNGDEVTLRGKLREPYAITVKGNKLNEEWGTFVNSHATQLERGNLDAVKADIQKYAKLNPDATLSALLIAYDYVATADDAARATELLAALNAEKLPTVAQRHIDAVNDGTELTTASARRIDSFALLSSADSLSTFTASKAKASLLYFWLPEDAQRKASMRRLRRLSGRYGASLQIADITLESDTSAWKRTLRADSVMTSWKHYWALGGRANAELARMGVVSAPTYIAIDSDGKQLYRGASTDDAVAAIEDYLKR